MALIVKGTTVKKLVANGTTSKTGICNGVTVFNAEKVLVTGSSVQESYTLRKLLTGGSGSASGATLTTSAGRKVAGIYWTVDVTDYTTLSYSITVSGNSGTVNTVCWGVYSNIGTASADRGAVVRPSSLESTSTSGNGTFTSTFDVSSISGTRYIWVYVDGAGSNCSACTVTVKELKLT